MKQKEPLLQALIKEIELSNDFLDNRKLSSIYFGGGTPSLLTASEIKEILDKLSSYYTWDDQAEITIETNPDDVTTQYLSQLYDLGINRLSVGIQSFDEADLKYMNRAHNHEEADACLRYIKESPFDNYTLDLIYGAPTTSHKIWQDNVDKALSYGADHISAYCLTIEEGTAMGKWLSQGKIDDIEDNKANEQFAYLISELTRHEFEHYEISNFARKGKYAVHNTNYWRGKQYLGLGPAAHSYDRSSRSWNIAHNAKYIQSINEKVIPRTTEVLSTDDRYNELVMTGLRTMWGVQFADIIATSSISHKQHLEQCVQDLWLKDKIVVDQNGVRLTEAGKVFADKIASLCFI